MKYNHNISSVEVLNEYTYFKRFRLKLCHSSTCTRNAKKFLNISIRIHIMTDRLPAVTIQVRLTIWTNISRTMYNVILSQIVYHFRKHVIRDGNNNISVQVSCSAVVCDTLYNTETRTYLLYINHTAYYDDAEFTENPSDFAIHSVYYYYYCVRI